MAYNQHATWGFHNMEKLSALLPLCEENPPGTDGGMHQSPVDSPKKQSVMQSFDVLFKVGWQKLLNNQVAVDLRHHEAWRSCGITVTMIGLLTAGPVVVGCLDVCQFEWPSAAPWPLKTQKHSHNIRDKDKYSPCKFLHKIKV